MAKNKKTRTNQHALFLIMEIYVGQSLGDEPLYITQTFPLYLKYENNNGDVQFTATALVDREYIESKHFSLEDAIEKLKTKIHNKLDQA